MEKIFYNVNSKLISELIKDATKRIVYISPGINKEILGEILKVKDKIGNDNICIVIDANSNVLRFGYGDEESVSFFEENKSLIKTEKGLRIGFICTDNDGYVFTPTPLSLEDEMANVDCPNAIHLSGPELERILTAVVPKSLTDNSKKEIGKENVNSEVIQKINNDIKNKPFVKPDLQRQLNVINSIFQFVKIDFEGSKLQNRTFKIDAKDLGITNTEIAEKISTSYKIFKSLSLPHKFEEMEHDLNKIKKSFLEQVDNVGLLLLNEKSKKFNDEINKLKQQIANTKKESVKMVNMVLEKSKETLVEFIVSNLMKLSQKEKGKLIPFDTPNKENLKNYVSNKLKRNFPDADQLLNNMELSLKIFNISDQMMNDKKIVERIEKHFKKPFEEIANIEKALGTKEHKNEIISLFQ